MADLDTVFRISRVDGHAVVCIADVIYVLRKMKKDERNVNILADGLERLQRLEECR